MASISKGGKLRILGYAVNVQRVFAETVFLIMVTKYYYYTPVPLQYSNNITTTQYFVGLFSVFACVSCIVPGVSTLMPNLSVW